MNARPSVIPSLFYLLDHYPDLSGSVADRYAAVLDQAALAESLGYESIWVAEHHFHQLGTAPNPAVLLAAIAARTGTIRVGPAVAVLPMRHAALTAENYAMVDNISAGRLNLGVGAGSSQFEFGGLDLDVAGAKKVMAECLVDIRRRFEGANVGQHDQDTINISTVQAVPPTFVAASSVDASRDVGRTGSSLLVISTPGTTNPEEMGNRFRAHRDGLVEGDHDPDAHQAVCMAFGFCAATEDEARSLAGPALARSFHRMGGPLFDADEIYDRMVGAGTAVLGDLTQARDLIEGFRAAGVDRIAFLSGFGALPIEGTTKSIRLLAEATRSV